ncbi:MAG: 50S ribosomal protein L30 [Holosporales bacterium]|jgi:large subunit ribosomal protein L30|nr:50S ribosomal protein L30 [Holosporales bacterium]
MAEKKSLNKKTAASASKSVKKPAAKTKEAKASAAAKADVAVLTARPKKVSVAAASKSSEVKPASRVQSGARVKVTQVRSFIGRKENQALSLKALGLGKIGKSRILLDGPETRGLLCRVKHLVTVEVV